MEVAQGNIQQHGPGMVGVDLQLKMLTLLWMLDMTFGFWCADIAQLQ